LLDQFFLYKTFDGQHPTHNAWEVHKINPSLDFRSFWADAVVIKDFKKSKPEIRLKPAKTKEEVADTVGLVTVLARKDEPRHNQLKHLQSDIEHHAKGLTKHLRTEQLSQGVLTKLCLMFARVSIYQASHFTFFEHAFICHMDLMRLTGTVRRHRSVHGDRFNPLVYRIARVPTEYSACHTRIILQVHWALRR
jgi:hypothetical protein